MFKNKEYKEAKEKEMSTTTTFLSLHVQELCEFNTAERNINVNKNSF